MKYLVLLILLIGFVPLVDAYLAVPPTGSFKIINMTGGNVTAQFTNDFVEFVAGTGIIISPDYSMNTITFSASPSVTAREETVGIWTVDQTLTNIGTSFTDVYTSGRGDPLRIDTNGKTTATLIIDWTKIGTGNQTCQIVSTTNSTVVLIRFSNLVSTLNINATQDISANAENRIDTFKPQCMSTELTDSPIWHTGQVLLR